ncbi:hypothetical protein KAR91_03945 [Candidatus Pacearchaeota archaeon]|nr:hypothetical protein [Candidatus Pacearchaeota archaeon]
MDRRTLTALKGSIHKWQRIIDDRRATDNGAENCTLCKTFVYCSSCPVGDCDKSPYAEWAEHHREVHNHYWNDGPKRRHKDCPKCIELATKERDFLISLLPKNNK